MPVSMHSLYISSILLIVLILMIVLMVKTLNCLRHIERQNKSQASLLFEISASLKERGRNQNDAESQ